MAEQLHVNVSSEIGELQAVIMHTPGREVESMGPTSAAEALYSDILSLEIAQREYAPFRSALERVCRVIEVEDLLTEVLAKPQGRQEVLEMLCPANLPGLAEELSQLPPATLSRMLVEGVPMPRNTLTQFLSPSRYAIPPLYNLFFMRDASMSVYDSVLLGRMAGQVRWGETRILRTIFNLSDSVHAPVMDPNALPDAGDVRIEGGDVHIAREDILLIGTGLRTSPLGIDFLVSQLVAKGLHKPQHILIQELPHTPESFIHLDMVFTLLDRDRCMVYGPVILGPSPYRTIHMTIEPNGKTSIRYVEGLIPALRELGMPLEPIVCGGSIDPWHWEREQWHSGTNFFSFAPGKVLGYSRNLRTIEQMSACGFEVIPAAKVASGEVDVRTVSRCVVTVDGSELPRGGGGARCMTMPIVRKPVSW